MNRIHRMHEMQNPADAIVIGEDLDARTYLAIRARGAGMLVLGYTPLARGILYAERIRQRRNDTGRENTP